MFCPILSNLKFYVDKKLSKDRMNHPKGECGGREEKEEKDKEEEEEEGLEEEEQNRRRENYSMTMGGGQIASKLCTALEP